ncbi:MAG TPA: hypothetical protein VIB08_07050 [Thermoanaerobaculia bacterium]|jgi:hypothetical protein
MRRAVAAAAGLLLVAAWATGDAASDAAKAELSRERRKLSEDTRRYAELSRRLEASLAALAEATKAAADAAGESAEEIARREEAITAAEQEVRGLLDRRRLQAERIADRRRGVAALEAELAGKPVKKDALSGKWAVSVDPGDQRGLFRLALDGTIVSGDYQLDGGWNGSLRGTLVEDRLRLERVDSKLGFNAIFYGRLARDGRSIAGTWEATTFGTGDAGAGQWRAGRQAEEEAP